MERRKFIKTLAGLFSLGIVTKLTAKDISSPVMPPTAVNTITRNQLAHAFSEFEKQYDASVETVFCSPNTLKNIKLCLNSREIDNSSIELWGAMVKSRENYLDDRIVLHNKTDSLRFSLWFLTSYTG